MVASRSSTKVVFTRIPISGLVGCCIPVVPDSYDVEAPMEERTELCAVDAHWMVGMVPTCDLHARYVCEQCDIDWPELVAEAERDQADADRPREVRERHSQADARGHKEHFLGAQS